MITRPALEIVEVEYSVSPGGVDSFEVYSTHMEDQHMPPLLVTEDLTEAVLFCYDLGKDFIVRTLSEYHAMENSYV